MGRTYSNWLKVGTVFGLAILGSTEMISAQSPWPQDTKHPSLIIETIPMPATYMNMGVTFLSDGRLVVATTGERGGGGILPPNANSLLMIVSGLTGDMSGLSVKKVADMWRQPAGVVVANDKVYLSDRDAFYQINNIENPTNISANRTKIISWPQPDGGLVWGPNGEMWHQWIHTPGFFNGKFYGPYGGSIAGGGPSTAAATSSYSGAVFTWNPDGTGGFTKVAGGLRQANGMGMTPSGQFFLTDNQGSWFPACTFSLVKNNKFYGHRQTPPNAPNWAENLPYEPPVMWMVDGVHQSASQPLYMDKGPYAGDFIVGDENSPGLSRIALDKVSDGNYNGSMYFFTGGFGTAGINRLAMNPTEESIVVGTFLAQGDWPDGSAKPMYRIKFGTAKTFEMREIHSRQGGVEIVFSQPVDPTTVVAGNFTLTQTHYNRTSTYGCCVETQTKPIINSLAFSDDNKRVFLALTGGEAATDRVVKFATVGIKSATGGSLFHGTAYFTHNYQSSAAFVAATPVGISQDRTSGANAMDLAIGNTAMPGLLRVKVDLKGVYSVTVHGLNGSLVEQRTGSGPSEFTFISRSGEQAMRVLQVKQSGHSYIRTVIF